MSKQMRPPKKGGTPKRITTKNAPGGPHTPGAKKKRKSELQRRLAAKRDSQIVGN